MLPVQSGVSFDYTMVKTVPGLLTRRIVRPSRGLAFSFNVSFCLYNVLAGYTGIQYLCYQK